MFLRIGTRVKSFRIVEENFILRRLLREMGVLISKTIYPGGVKKSIGGTGRFIMHPEFAFASYEGWGSDHNNGFAKLLRLAEGRRFIFDIGAHIGLCSLPISRVIGDDGVCYAFEPVEENLRFLSWHLEANKVNNVAIVPCMVGDECLDKAEFYIDAECAGMSSIVYKKKNRKRYRKVERRQVTIDSFVRDNGCVPELIKVDAEGSEIKILLGASEVLREYHPEIVLSVHPRQLKALGYSVEDLTDLVHSMNYRLYDVNGVSEKLADKLGFREYYLH